jgi:phosphatidylserine/phosphatidylglycerophosphate/cardiolipin synthase-like enzyme
MHVFLGLSLLVLGTGPAVALETVSEPVQMVICFTPGDDCEGQIVAAIDRARASLLLQAYSFTSPAIAKAIVAARGRGVRVEAVLDKSQRREKYSGATFLLNAGIPVLIDERPAIAHNKVIVIDDLVTIQGSYNFTRSAQERNAENLTVITNKRVAAAYTKNIRARMAQSVPFGR